MSYELKRDNAANDAAVIRDALDVLREIGGGINEDATIRLTALADSIEEQGKAVRRATTKPAVGDTVHYVDNPALGGGHARCFAAEVMTVNADGTIDVREHEQALGLVYAIREGKPGDLYTWHLPCPTEGERETNRLLHHITGGDFL